MRYRYLRYPGGKGKAVTFSYDDGCTDDRRFVEILDRHGIKCTFNHNSDAIKKGKAYSKEDCEALFLSKGHEIAVHGYWHRAEGAIRPIDGIRDVLDCRLALEAKFGRIIRGMAYPDSGITLLHNGTRYEDVRTYLGQLDIAYARTLRGDNDSFLLPTDWYAWVPTAHHKNPKLKEYMQKFLEYSADNSYHARRFPVLFYLWGHSYEFDNDKNWDLAEEICATLGGRDDIWYATNIEIYEYVKAYESLVFSADGSIVYNPTLYTVWFDVDAVAYQIAPGETLRIAE